MIATTSHIITEEEYLQLEEKATVRHEFISGKMYEMPGGSNNHEDVISNIHVQLSLQRLKTVSQGLRVRNPQNKSYYYPDVLVRPHGGGKAGYTETPLLIAEVLSPSTRINDLSDKFIAYRHFASLEYYLVVEPDFCYVNLFSKDESGEWQSEVYNQFTDVVPLPKLNASLPVKDIYEGLDWAE
jgi:Uma2 family endonuclease